MASVRPAMHARDSSGRRVSLLNDEPYPGENAFYSHPSSRLDKRQGTSRSNSYTSEFSSPRTPDLRRSDSYDSRASHDPISPITPSMVEYGRPVSYGTSYSDPSLPGKSLDRASISGSYSSRQDSAVKGPQSERNPSSYDDDYLDGAASERTGSSSGKRYPCRFKESQGCDKSFTTSGHASRHSKIHTAEKAVHCSFPGCQKKFTRADNMKQHLETHYKERSRSSTSHKSIPSTTRLTVAAGVKKQSSNGARLSRPASPNGWPKQLSINTVATISNYSGERYYPSQSPSTSPYDALNMGNFQTALPRPFPKPGGSENASGLDALAAAVASQAGK